MGNIRLKQEPRSSKKNISDLNKSNSGKKFVLSDISKEELIHKLEGEELDR